MKGRLALALLVLVLFLALMGTLVTAQSAAPQARHDVPPPPAAGSQPALTPSSAAPASDIPEEWLATAREEIRQSEYRVTWQETTFLSDVPAAYQAPNRAHNLRTYFTPARVRVVPRTGDEGQRTEDGDAARWELGLVLTAYGYGSDVHPAGEAELSVADNRVEYRRAGLTESYANDEEGLHQGFLLAAGAPGGSQGAGVPFHLDLAFSGSLRPVLTAGGDAIKLHSPGGQPVLGYGGLQATDAAGNVLPARLELRPSTPQTLRLTVEHADAAYPINLEAVLTSLAPAAERAAFSDAAPAAVDAAFTDLGGLSPLPDWTAEGDVAYAEFGFSASTAGDVNGDGYSDIVVGAPMFDGGQAEQGRVFVYHGSNSGVFNSVVWTIEHNGSSMQLGYAVANAGDVNNDGYADIIVGAPYYNYPGEGENGKVLVYHGSATGLDRNRTRPTGGLGNADWYKNGPNAGDHLGLSVATAGDVNNDRHSDVIVGAPDYEDSPFLPDKGLAWVFHGSPAGLSSSADWSAVGATMGDRFGNSVATAGHVNGDDYADVIVGAIDYDNGQAGEGGVFVYHGSASGLNPTANWTAESNQAGARFGLAVDTAGDVNGDNFSDVIVGADYYENGEGYEGGAFVYYGSAAGLGSPGTPDNADWRYESNEVWALLGCWVSTAGDVNGDGYADVIVGARGNAGRAYAFRGSGSGLSSTPSWVTFGEVADTRYGRSVGTAGDVNGDGYTDVIVGARWYTNGQEKEGQVSVYHGSPAGLSTSPAWTGEGNQAGAHFGSSIGTAGDVDGNGHADVIIGMPSYDNGQGKVGRVFVYAGRAAGLSATAEWTLEGSQAGAGFGSVAGRAGDVNGDGYTDVIVGAPEYTHNLYHEGRILVYYGSAAGLSTVPNWTAEGGGLGINFGRSAGAAGDVNGDGYADVVVGAPHYSLNMANRGRVLVFHGSAEGLSAVPDWTAEGNQELARFGLSVGTAGDVNCDGYSDIIVGTPYYQHQGADVGAAFVFHGATTGLSAEPDWTAVGDQQGAWFGHAVSTAGAVYGGVCGDVIVGAPYYDRGETNEGRVFLYEGFSTGLRAAPSWTDEGNREGACFGESVAAAGDVNGDGYSDIIVGAPYYPSAQVQVGAAFVYHGAGTGPGTSPAWMVEGQAGAMFGGAVAAAGDVNGDAYADVLVGAPLFSDGQQEEGQVQLYYGNDGGGLPIRPRQLNQQLPDLPIALLGLTEWQDHVYLRMKNSVPLGREWTGMRWQVAPVGVHFNHPSAIDLHYWSLTKSTSTGIPRGLWIGGLTPGTPYHWRLRTVYWAGNRLGQPAGRWIHIPWNGWLENDFRTKGVHRLYLPLMLNR